jgi:hypothetical protein
MKDFIIVSAFTKKTNYENIIKNLEKDCLFLKVPHILLGYDTTGKWVENTMLKPFLLLGVLEKIKDYKNLIWIDADARLLSYPTYFGELDRTNVDLALFQMGSRTRVASGTIFIKNNNNMKIFLEKWWALCKNDKVRSGDQKCLRDLLKTKVCNELKIKYSNMPYSYCYIYDDTLRKLEPSIPKLNDTPVICHMQASRDKKNAQRF